jgi:MoaA/NifB/PqqE/SkfB family radical SAM enzyme
MGAYSPKSGNADNKTIDSFIKLVANLTAPCAIKLIGGEPTFHPRFFEIAQLIIKHKHNLHIGTNFSASNDFFKKLIDESERENQITLLVSIHLSQINSVDEFIKKVISLKEYGKDKIFIRVSSVILEENIELLKNINERLSQYNISILFQRLKINSKTGFYKYTDKTEEYLQKNFPDRIGEKIEGVNTFGLMCKTGCHFIRISLDGEVNRCYNFQQKLYGLGNINNIWRPLKNVTPCLSKRCTCLLPVEWGLIEFGNYNRELAEKIKNGW